ncbi:MAG: tRNA (adenosine(37)-N6)-threonylcarbamoyltransferase complex dimerization subunit type 1 TsaB [Betaproteobacteria bacterium]|nr:tRNA (adenosine(37)-N6)-threonylcarbamoyltransferase complex dimerization subunit type 1 TsaB [Betaproteobacteria bacterium]
MIVLALETSTELGTCALWRAGTVDERRCPPGQPHSETLLPLVRELLADSGVAFAELDAIAFGAGPGAFTGLRIACGLAQGLAVGAGVPVVPVGSLDAMAETCSGERVLALLDARMGEVYSGCFTREAATGLVPSGDVSVAPPEAVALPSGAGWLACGNAPAAYPALAQRLVAAGIAWQPGILPTAGAVAAIAARRLAAGEAGHDPADAGPLYVRDKVARTIAERLSVGGRA